MDEDLERRSRTAFGLPADHVPDLDARRRFRWLVMVPTAIAFTAWIPLPGAASASIRITISGFLPLVALLVVLTYLAVTCDWRRLWPFIPFAVVAVVFTVSMVSLAAAVAREPEGAFIPLIQVVTGFVQPWLALGGGMVAVRGLHRRPRKTPRERLTL